MWEGKMSFTEEKSLRARERKENKEGEKKRVCVGGNAIKAVCLMFVPRLLVIILAQAGNSLRRVLKSQKASGI